MERGSALALLGFASAMIAPRQAPAQFPDLAPREAALVVEARHLAETVGRELWPAWEPGRVPIMLRSGTHDWLLRHPAPPPDFRPAWSATLAESLHVRAASSSGSERAAYPVNDVTTSVMALPGPDDDARRWVLLLVHELFHGYQGTRRISDAFTGEFAGFNDLTFPFPYQDSAVRAALRMEAEAVHQLLRAPQVPSAEAAVQFRLLGLARTLLGRVAPAEQHLAFARESEWNEGVGRYTEREVARRAADSTAYRSTEPFLTHHPRGDYGKAWDAHYADMLNPVRFVGEGVQGRVMFYYLGLGKATVLDRLDPAWRLNYLTRSLDELIVAANRH